MPIYMKIDGIDGSVTDERYRGWHDLFSFSWGVSNATSGGGGGGGGAGRATFSDMSLTKPSGQGSPGFMVRCAGGRHFPTVKIVMLRTIEDREIEYQTYELEDCFITGYDVSGDGDSVPTESLSLNFTKIKFTQRFLGDGSVRTQIGQWDLRRGTGNWTP